MHLKTKRRLFYLLWLLFVLAGPVTLLQNFSINKIVSDNVLTVNFFQRLTALIAFALLFFQVEMGAFMNKLIQIIGSKAYRLHVVQGIAAYALVLFHPIFYTVNNSIVEDKFWSFLIPNFTSS